MTVTGKTLKSLIIDLIRINGPLTISQYMKLVLTHPNRGFYMKNDVFGTKGHFTTNPEISQIFGEIMGIWILQEWRRFGTHKPLKLVEFGPGRGTLMTDIVRTIKKLHKDDQEHPLIRFIEVSDHLKEIQKKTLLSEVRHDLFDRVKWFNRIEDLDEDKTGFTAFVAHEFFDSLPIHKFVRERESKKWRELMIDYNKDNDLIYRISRQPSLSTRLLIPKDFDGDHIEVCPEAAMILDKVSNHINQNGNACMLVCDYGFEKQTNPNLPETQNSLQSNNNDRDTFRAFKDHEQWHPLKDPGEADLTADVDFGYLKSRLKDKCHIFGTVNQKDFLLRCGLEPRLKKLLEKASDLQKGDLISGAKLITEDMGERYKFLAIFPKDSEHLFRENPPAGFS